VARRAGSGELGRLSIGVVEPMTYSVLPAIVREFHARYPEVQLDLSEMHSGQQAPALRDDRLQLGFLHPPEACTDLAIETIMTEAVMVALPRNHPRAADAKVHLCDLADEPLVIFRRDVEPALFDTYQQLCADAGLTPAVVHAANPMHLIVGLVAAGLGYTLLPASVRNLQRPDIVYRALHPPAPRVALAAVWRAGDTSPALHAFLEVTRHVTRLHRPERDDRRHTPHLAGASHGT
ncbi:MAG: LysR family substrate-binding domain-containing protein, partial [Thermomicrobiales bacterium]